MDGHTITIIKSDHYVLSNKSLFTFITSSKLEHDDFICNIVYNLMSYG